MCEVLQLPGKVDNAQIILTESNWAILHHYVEEGIRCHRFTVAQDVLLNTISPPGWHLLIHEAKYCNRGNEKMCERARRSRHGTIMCSGTSALQVFCMRRNISHIHTGQKLFLQPTKGWKREPERGEMTSAHTLVFHTRCFRSEKQHFPYSHQQKLLLQPKHLFVDFAEVASVAILWIVNGRLRKANFDGWTERSRHTNGKKRYALHELLEQWGGQKNSPKYNECTQMQFVLWIRSQWCFGLLSR